MTRFILQGIDVKNQEAVDNLLLKLDGTDNKGTEEPIRRIFDDNWKIVFVNSP